MVWKAEGSLTTKMYTSLAAARNYINKNICRGNRLTGDVTVESSTVYVGTPTEVKDDGTPLAQGDYSFVLEQDTAGMAVLLLGNRRKKRSEKTHTGSKGGCKKSLALSTV